MPDGLSSTFCFKLMGYYLGAALGATVILPAVTGLIRFKQANQVFYPFIFLMWLGLLNEAVSKVTSYYLRTNSYNSNVYCLFEAWLILYLFYKWRLFEKKTTPLIIAAVLFAGWITENFAIASMKEFNSYFTIAYTFLIVVLSISMLNQILISEKSLLIKNPRFLILLGFILFFSYSCVVEIFWKYSFTYHAEMSKHFFQVITYLNAFNNILYTYAILCMRRKLRFTMQ